MNHHIPTLTDPKQQASKQAGRQGVSPSRVPLPIPPRPPSTFLLRTPNECSLLPEPETRVLGGPDLHVNSGSTINLTCIVNHSPDPPPFIFWYHESEVREGRGRGSLSESERERRQAVCVCSEKEKSRKVRE
ncbi:hypothetical protein E2C01_091895 [Portunus trituberculatus]|uniref:Ig-like domain-containing protein n=1 Tax=Portunus trituberculatus TaxID=210409 RepID=A0A5B7JQM2_PORTR|nr:hypothetical protein [Portunus trituberculatus]